MNAPGENAGGQYVQKVREDTNRAMAEVMGQNERLRVMVAALESDRARLLVEKIRLQEQLMNVREDLAERIEEHTALLRRLSEVQRENESVAGRFVEIETQNTNLANLYVAGYQLHGSLDRRQVLDAIKEIVINLIGSEQLAIYERTAGATFRLAASFGLDEEKLATMVGGEYAVEKLGEGHVFRDPHDNQPLTACVPLRIGERVIGAILIFRLLEHKPSLQPVDHELFDLLAVHAAPALYCAWLHEAVAVAG